MTKFQIVSPNGVKVCVIEADKKDYSPGLGTVFYKSLDGDYQKLGDIETLPDGWASIQLGIIIKEEANFDSTIAYLKNGYLFYKYKIEELAKSGDILDGELMKKMTADMEEYVRAIKYLEGK